MVDSSWTIEFVITQKLTRKDMEIGAVISSKIKLSNTVVSLTYRFKILPQCLVNDSSVAGNDEKPSKINQNQNRYAQIMTRIYDNVLFFITIR